VNKDTRITFRLTGGTINRINKIMEKDKYLKKSDLIRDAVWKGLMIIEKEMI